MENITPNQTKLLEYIIEVGGIQDCLKGLIDQVISQAAESGGLSAKLCEHIYFTSNMANLIEKVGYHEIEHAQNHELSQV
jgi:hypothetical protein